MFGDDVKHSQLRKGNHHGCRIDETLQLEVSGDQNPGKCVRMNQMQQSLGAKHPMQHLLSSNHPSSLDFFLQSKHGGMGIPTRLRICMQVNRIQMTSSLRCTTPNGGRRTSR